MKLAIFYPYFNRQGGVEKIIDFYLKNLAEEKNVEITCFGLRASAEIKNDYMAKVKFKELKIPLVNPLLTHLCFFFWASWVVRFSKFDVYYSHFPILSFNKNFLYHVHSVQRSVIRAIEKNNGWSGKLRYFLRRYYPLPIVLEKGAFRFHENKKFIAVSPKIKREIIEEYKIPENAIATIPAPIALEKFSFLNREKWQKEARGQYDFLSRPNWLWLGTVVNRLTEKNVRLMLQALTGVWRNVGLIIVGLPRKKDVMRLRRWLKALCLEKRVFFLGPQSNLEKIYSLFDFFILPSFYESFGLSVMESLLMGTPAIVSKEIGCVDFLPVEIKREMLIELADIKQEGELAAVLKTTKPLVMEGKTEKLSVLADYVRKLNINGLIELKKLLNI
ncbi:MAG TPA: glycosyltransferase family 4 protein [Candidatus Paceibacterota bacterium]|nr:glycosyltransferase family 4 protein [Candidatus Paceibacterota bacterium]